MPIGETLPWSAAHRPSVKIKSRFVARVGRIPGHVAVDVDPDAAGRIGADLRPAVDREPGHEVAAGLAVAAGECRIAVGLDGVALAVQFVAGQVDDRPCR